MSSMRLKADVLAPKNVKTLEYDGEHPSRVLKIIPSLMKTVFKISSTKFFEDDIRWDNSGENVDEFYGAWRAKDEKDKRTSVWVNIKIQGDQDKKDKKGYLIVWISATLVTDLPYSNILEKMISRSYSFFFYSEQRRRYIEEARKRLIILEGELRKQLGIMGG